MSIESAEALWELSRRALERPDVAALIRTNAPEHVAAGLAAVERGDEFRDELEVFLERYGYRNESFFEISFPTWREDPRFVISAVKGYMDAPGDLSPRLMHGSVAERRQAVTDEAVRRLGSKAKADAFLLAQRRA